MSSGDYSAEKWDLNGDGFYETRNPEGPITQTFTEAGEYTPGLMVSGFGNESEEALVSVIVTTAGEGEGAAEGEGEGSAEGEGEGMTEGEGEGAVEGEGMAEGEGEGAIEGEGMAEGEGETIEGEGMTEEGEGEAIEGEGMTEEGEGEGAIEGEVEGMTEEGEGEGAVEGEGMAEGEGEGAVEGEGEGSAEGEGEGAAEGEGEGEKLLGCGAGPTGIPSGTTPPKGRIGDMLMLGLLSTFFILRQSFRSKSAGRI